MSELIPYFFALDHTNYSRWLPIHLRDMTEIERKQPGVASEFLKGYFTVHKSERVFSAIAIDQAHEQNNKIIKGDGGAVGLTEDPSALRRWMIAGPETSRPIEEFETVNPSRNHKVDSRHHEESEANQVTFFEHVKNMTKIMSELGNPFGEESKYLIVLDTKEVIDVKVSNAIGKMLNIGNEQYESFMKRLSAGPGKSKFYDPIRRNKLPLFSRKPTPAESTGKSKLIGMKEDCQLFSRLFISCQSRQCDLNEFFRHENQNTPPSLSQKGSLNMGTKSELMKLLEAHAEIPDSEPTADVILNDGAVLINSRPPGAARTFDNMQPILLCLSFNHLVENIPEQIWYLMFIEMTVLKQQLGVKEEQG